MSFNQKIRDLKMNFMLETIQIKIIDANHGLFLHSFARHRHSFYELHYIAGGHGRLLLDDGEYELNSGLLFLHAPKIYHAQLTDAQNPMEEYHIAFEIQNLPSKQDNEIYTALTSSDFYICRDTHAMDTLFKELEAELDHCQLGYTTAVSLLLQRILLAAARNFSHKKAELVANHTTPDDRRALLMDEAFLFSYQNLTLEGLATLLNLSTRHTERLIREKYGTTFVKYRTQSRLNAAVNMMADTDLKLSEISEQCGFSSYLHFGKVFQETFGISPSAYRKSLLASLGTKHD